MGKRLPEWLRRKVCGNQVIHEVKGALRRRSLHTVCEEARCPNIAECFARNTATFMIMGNVCTRKCGFCAVTHGKPAPLDPDEPNRVAAQVKDMGLKHVVITSVTRDDLEDGGASHFVLTIQSLRRELPSVAVEVLTPDFGGRAESVKMVCDAGPDVFNHNVETIERLTPVVRSRASYRRSLGVLRLAHHGLQHGLTKSGFMLGLGETRDEILRTLDDLRGTGCDVITMGQYLRPSKHALQVVEYVLPETFEELGRLARGMGFKHVFSAPLVRSSYMADQVD